MYRYHVDNAITYTPDDVALFRESPFALWMERLTLENPDHGIPPDMHSREPAGTRESPDSLVATLRAEGRHVVPIDRASDELTRRTATLAAMHSGADFIVNGQLAVDTLSGCANLLMRTSGYSQLGDFLYIPCETQSKTSLDAAFRLSFVADLLCSLQGQLPPQMLIIRDGADVIPLQAEDYIYYYRAVQLRFMHAMHNFRKHRMPDPAESSHFGRWSECASEVLKQRALREQQAVEQQSEPVGEEPYAMPQLRVASGFVTTMVPQCEADDPVDRAGFAHDTSDRPVHPETRATDRRESGHTLAEQARLLAPGSYRIAAAPGHTPNLARFGHSRSVGAAPDSRGVEHNRRSSDAALQNLEFIGSTAPDSSGGARPTVPLAAAGISAPAPTLRESSQLERRSPDQTVTSGTAGLPDLEPRAPMFLPPEQTSRVEPPPVRLESRPLGDDGFRFNPHPLIDMDSAPAPNLAPAVIRPEAVKNQGSGVPGAAMSQTNPARTSPVLDADSAPVSTISSSLITSNEAEDC